MCTHVCTCKGFPAKFLQTVRYFCSWHDAIWRCVKNVGKVTWPASLVTWPASLVTWPSRLGHVTTVQLVTWPSTAIEYLACAFFIIKLKVEGNLKCGYNAHYHFQCKVAINLGSFESVILLCSWSQRRRSRGWTCNDHLRPRFDQYRYYFENMLEWTFETLRIPTPKESSPVSKSFTMLNLDLKYFTNTDAILALLELTAEKLHFHGPKSGKKCVFKVQIVPKPAFTRSKNCTWGFEARLPLDLGNDRKARVDVKVVFRRSTPLGAP